MKNLILSLLFLPALTLASNTDYVGLQYGSWGNDTDTNVYSINYQNVSEKLTAGISYSYSDTDTVFGTFESDVLNTSLEYAFGSFVDGSIYSGLTLAFDAGTWVEIFEVGYAKRSMEEVGYELGVLTADGDTAIVGELRVPLGDNGVGWTLKVQSDDDYTFTALGISVAF